MPFPSEGVVYDYQLDDGGISGSGTSDNDEEEEEKITSGTVCHSVYHLMNLLCYYLFQLLHLICYWLCHFP